MGRLLRNGLLATAFAGFGALAPMMPQQAAAVVYCKAVGVPKGCVARPARPAVACTRPGYPVGCVGGVGTPGLGAPGVGLQPANRGGPVNRPGLR